MAEVIKGIFTDYNAVIYYKDGQHINDVRDCFRQLGELEKKALKPGDTVWINIGFPPDKPSTFAYARTKVKDVWHEQGRTIVDFTGEYTLGNWETKDFLAYGLTHPVELNRIVKLYDIDLLDVPKA